jgi:hypothetical protein
VWVDHYTEPPSDHIFITIESLDGGRQQFSDRHVRLAVVMEDLERTFGIDPTGWNVEPRGQPIGTDYQSRPIEWVEASRGSQGSFSQVRELWRRLSGG